MTLGDVIDRIGAEMVACAMACGGIHRDQAIGSLPRCLVLEQREGGTGCAVVGINPGRASAREREFYLAHGCSYDAVVGFWREVNGFGHPYYVRLRRLVDALGVAGPILWTELAKCESALGISGLPPLQTLRSCTGRYLLREIAALPLAAPVLAVGGEAFKACAYLCPDRAVVGVPHPTGSRGHFARLFFEGVLLRSVREQFGRTRGGAVWLES